jgi:hypothetical protein
MHRSHRSAPSRRRAKALAFSPATNPMPESPGQGWVAEEALTIALYCALVAPNYLRRTPWSGCHPGPLVRTAISIKIVFRYQRNSPKVESKHVENS